MSHVYKWLNENSLRFLTVGRGYLENGETVDQRFTCIAETAEDYLQIKDFAKEFLEFIKESYYSIATPIICNFGKEKHLPISCYGFNVQDSSEDIATCLSEMIIQSKHGGGTSGYFGNLRCKGSQFSTNGTSDGPMSYIGIYEKAINVFSQGSTRRGHFAPYLDIDHADIEDFLTIRKNGSLEQTITHGVCVGDKWLNEMIDGDQNKRRIWAKILDSRRKDGLPYIMFKDNVNNYKPECYADEVITHSNMCTEIMLPDNEFESFICALSSMNISTYNKWKNNPKVIKYLTYFMNAVIDEFIDKTEDMKHMEKSREFAINHRAIGIGILGYHSYLQQERIPFESQEARKVNIQIAKSIQKYTLEASQELVREHGFKPPSMLNYYPEKTARMNTCLTAYAPTVSTSFIFGQVSKSFEPFQSNYYIADLAKGKYTVRNKELQAVLKEYNRDNEDTWQSIMMKGGSVQHLDFLSEHDKNVFKTFMEISQKEIVNQAISRQPYIDQGQSLNLMIHPKAETRDVNALILDGWRGGIKTFYYQYNVNAAQEYSRELLTCSSCEA